MTSAARPRSDPELAFHGLYSGTVIDVGSESRRGAIKVAVPAVFDGDDAKAAVWARPCLPWGHYFVPDRDARVWIAFEDGNPSCPVWLGIWYPDGKVPEAVDVSPPVQRLIRSSSGHEILLDDTKNGERVIVRDKTGSSIEMGVNEMIVHAAVDLTIEAPGHTITITADSILLTAGSVDVSKPEGP